MTEEDPKEDGRAAAAVVAVTLADFPVYDGSVPPDSFIRQCRRLAELGGISEDKLGGILTARCRGIALQLVECSGERGNVESLLTETFGPRQPEAAAAQLSAVVKGSMSVLDYSLNVRRLVTEACPEFFDAAKGVKKTCVPAYQAALYRHLLVGLSSEDKRLLSRQGVASFDAAVRELTREERLAKSCRDDKKPTGPTVSWDLGEASHCHGVSRSEEPDIPYGRSRDEASPKARRGDWWSQDDSPRARRRSPDGGRRWRGGSPAPPSRCAAGCPVRSSRHGAGRPRSPRVGRPERRSTRSPGRRDSASGGGYPQRPDTADRVPGEAGASPGREDGRRAVQCWSCRGFGHLKRHCPNELAGRVAAGW